jgi:hypothetical protein
MPLGTPLCLHVFLRKDVCIEYRGRYQTFHGAFPEAHNSSK